MIAREVIDLLHFMALGTHGVFVMDLWETKATVDVQVEVPGSAIIAYQFQQLLIWMQNQDPPVFKRIAFDRPDRGFSAELFFHMDPEKEHGVFILSTKE